MVNWFGYSKNQEKQLNKKDYEYEYKLQTPFGG
jgi:hypothetical protein